MIITAQKSELLKSIGIAMKAVPSRTTMDILNCILIDATVDDIRFTASDTELGIETVLRGEIVERGTIALEAKIFGDIVRKLPDGEVRIESDEALNKTTITCENRVYSIMGRPGAEYPHLPEIEKEDPLTLSQFALREMVRQTIFSIAVNDANRIMTGASFEIHENEVRMICLDGHRIAIRQLQLDESCADHKVIIPGKTLQELIKIMTGDQDDPVSVYFTKNEILFEMEGTIIISRLVEGTYFRVDQMLSNDFETKIHVNRAALLESVDGAMLFTSESEKRPLVMDITDDGMNLRISSQIGSMNDDVIVDKEGKDLMIGFNPKFILDALRVIDDEEIDIYFLNSRSPCFIRDEKQSYIYMVLPVNFVV